MRITCPICGDRDRREFYYMGADDFLDRPEEGDQDAMHRYLHLRENPAGVTKDLWHHEAGCGAWLVIERNVSTHEIFGVELASKVAS
ncbi:sarcosine oxidase subunit delta [uncultured Litoreibacter sp.]|uniref:sarcosine oxidase subunit delta n=1 Tax=uncultured Litoreibacter sp. TaxID=1392394 RepID=UPI00261A334B|nr:sarcosine oxidase subunit delta [uncultured Litoreibacter sp.]